MFSLLLLGLGGAQPAPGTLPTITPETVAAAIHPRLPQRFAPDVAMVAASAEGDALVLTYELSDAALASTTAEALSLRFSTAFCTAPGGAALLSGPMNFRADARSPNGRTLRGVVIESCPLASLPLPSPVPSPPVRTRG